MGWGDVARLRSPPRSRCRAWAENAYSEGTTHGDVSNGFFRRGATRVAAAGAPLVHSRFAAGRLFSTLALEEGSKGAAAATMPEPRRSHFDTAARRAAVCRRLRPNAHGKSSLAMPLLQLLTQPNALKVMK